MQTKPGGLWAKTLRARLYGTSVCPMQGFCRTVDDDGWLACGSAATVCVHVVLAGEIPLRTMLCDEHAAQARGIAVEGLIERLHSL